MLSKVYERNYDMMGAFEVSAHMMKLAQKNANGSTFLNAGRGNPNWINTLGRMAFCKLMQFGIEESKNTINAESIAGTPIENGIAKRLMNYLNEEDPTDMFIKKSIQYCAIELNMRADSLVKELVDAILGNNYPVPSRCLTHIEKILGVFMEKTLYQNSGLAPKTDIFPTEGGTSSIVYIFDSLKHNGLLNEGDKVAINIPIFTPYIQIPKLTNFDLVPMNLSSLEENNWQISKDEIEKLKDPSIKAFFLVNPSNPGSHALDDETLSYLQDVIRERKDLMIITDDVYGTFVDGFRSVYEIAPYNTLLVYSYSKLYGATGWRLGLIAINKDNVYDDLIKKLPEEKKKTLHHDYSIVTNEPEKMRFIDRICADSRSIGLYHTSGLSTPQQALMALFSLSHLICEGNDPYFDVTKEIIAKRYSKLHHALGLPEDNDRTNTKYYSLINIYTLAGRIYGSEFEQYLRENMDGDDFMLRLSQEEGVVLMMGEGFGAMEGTLRVSQANLKDDQYELVGYRILRILKDYFNESGFSVTKNKINEKEKTLSK